MNEWTDCIDLDLDNEIWNELISVLYTNNDDETQQSR